MASVYIEKRIPKNPKGKISYRVSFKDPITFQTKYYRTFYKYRDAQKAKTYLEDLIDNNKFSQIKKHKKKIQPLRFKEVGDLLNADWEKRVQLNEMSEKTFDDYTGRIDVLNRRYGKMLVAEFTKKMIEQYQQSTFERLSPASANRYLFILKQAFKMAILKGALLDDPTEGIRYLSEKEHERNNYLMPVDLIKLVEASKQTRAKFYLPALIYLGAEHGAAKQEALSLKWTDLDFEAEGIGLIKMFRTKNKKKRTEFMMPHTKAALLKWKAHLNFMRHRKRIQVVEDRFVFCRLNGQSIASFYSAWNNSCAIAGIEDFHYHDLRHTFCSNLIMAGSDLKETKEMIGHNDLSMTDRYTHLNALHKKALQDRLAERYAKPKQ